MITKRVFTINHETPSTKLGGLFHYRLEHNIPGPVFVNVYDGFGQKLEGIPLIIDTKEMSATITLSGVLMTTYTVAVIG